MHYKTIMMELLPQYPGLYKQLRTSRTLLTALDRYAMALKERHLAWIDRLAIARPESTQQQAASEALELALDELQAGLASASEPSETAE